MVFLEKFSFTSSFFFVKNAKKSVEREIKGQGHRVKVPASRVCQGQILCKVSSSQLPLLQRNELYF